MRILIIVFWRIRVDEVISPFLLDVCRWEGDGLAERVRHAAPDPGGTDQ
jgi:hypothetical protein